MDCNPPSSSVHGILQARILEWVSHSLLQGIFLTQGSNPGLLHCRKILYCLSHQENPSKKAVCKPSLDGCESEDGERGEFRSGYTCTLALLLLALVYRGDVREGTWATPP